jgi:hypothetical protein
MFDLIVDLLKMTLHFFKTSLVVAKAAGEQSFVSEYCSRALASSRSTLQAREILLDKLRIESLASFTGR